MKPAIVIVLLFAAGALAQSVPAARADASSRGFPLQDAEIRQTIERSGAAAFDLTAAQISSPPGFRTRVNNPELQLIGIARTYDPSVLMARIRCRQQADCRSILVEISISREAQKQAAKAQTEQVPKRRAAATQLADEPVLVAPGRTTLLVIEEAGMRITEPVRASRPARMREIVQVLDPASHRSRLAEVTGPGTVRLLAQTSEREVAR